MAWAARNGFYYLLDRNTGEFLLAKAFVRQTWAKGFDDKGRPDVIPGQEPTYDGNDQVFPGVDGGGELDVPQLQPVDSPHVCFRARRAPRFYQERDPARSGR
jgi:alcohol dehydrogenase (cytochrome c)